MDDQMKFQDNPENDPSSEILELDIQPRRKSLRRSAEALIKHHLVAFEDALYLPDSLAPTTTAAYAVLAACVAVVTVRRSPQNRGPLAKAREAVEHSLASTDDVQAFTEALTGEIDAILAHAARGRYDEERPAQLAVGFFDAPVDAECFESFVADRSAPSSLANAYALALEPYLRVAAMELQDFKLFAAVPFLRQAFYQATLDAVEASPVVVPTLLAGWLTTVEEAAISRMLPRALAAVERLAALTRNITPTTSDASLRLDFNVFAPPIEAIIAYRPNIQQSVHSIQSTDPISKYHQELAAARKTLHAMVDHDLDDLRIVDGRLKILAASLAGMRSRNAKARRQTLKSV